jgi:hypothetical protein
VQGELGPGRSRAVNRWLGDLGPIVVIGAVLWAKLVHVSILLPSVSWAGSELLNVVTILRAYPDVLSAILATLLLAVAPLLLLPRLWPVAFLLAIDLFLTTIAVSDLVHVRFYADVPSASDISRSHMLQWVTESILVLMRPVDAFYFADIALGIVALPFYAGAFGHTPDVTWADARRYGLGCVTCGFLIVTPTARLALDNSGIFDHSTLRLEAASSRATVSSARISRTAFTWASESRAGSPTRSTSPRWRRSWRSSRSRARRPRAAGGSPTRGPRAPGSLRLHRPRGPDPGAYIAVAPGT